MHVHTLWYFGVLRAISHLEMDKVVQFTTLFIALIYIANIHSFKT